MDLEKMRADICNPTSMLSLTGSSSLKLLEVLGGLCLHTALVGNEILSWGIFLPIDASLCLIRQFKRKLSYENWLKISVTYIFFSASWYSCLIPSSQLTSKKVRAPADFFHCILKNSINVKIPFSNHTQKVTLYEIGDNILLNNDPILNEDSH